MRPNVIIPARDMFGPIVNCFRFKMKWNTPLSGNGIWIGTLPAGAFLLPAWCKVITAFDGTTPILSCGTDGSQQNIMNATTDITEGTIGLYGPFNAGGALNFASPTPVYARGVFAGAVSAGEAIFVVPFINDNDR